MSGVDRRLHSEFEAKRILNYEMAGLISYAHHQPDKMPKYQPRNVVLGPADSEAEQARGRGAMIAWAMANGASNS